MIICPIHESNDCHEPAGQPTGGRFCSKTGRIVPGTVPGVITNRPTPRTQRILQREFEKLHRQTARGDYIGTAILRRKLERWTRYGVPTHVRDRS